MYVAMLMLSGAMAQGVDPAPESEIKQVATVRASAASDHLIRRGILTREVDELSDAYEMLVTNQVEAVVYDAPMLKHLARKRGEVRLVGETFQGQSYGFALTPGSPHREAINDALLELRERGAWRELHLRWFGEDD